MSPRNKKPPLDPKLRGVLRGLRWRIRSYVWLEGILSVLIWLGLTFWIGLALDYLPVLAGASEMPRAARVTLLGVVGIVSSYILYRGILRRTFVRLRDRNMALLLERSYPQFQDSLLTEVEAHDGNWDSGHQLTSEMLARTRSAALDHLDQVRPGDVINWRPLRWRALAAGCVVASVFLFGLYSQQAFATWVGRFYGLDDTAWARRAHISVIGFSEGPVKIGRGADHLLQVQADASQRVPRLCTAYYRTEDGERGQLVLNKRGPVRDGQQTYVFDGRPFRGAQSSVTFDVVGFDHRVRDCRLQVVEMPTIIGIAMHATLPEYTGLLPRRIPYRAGTSLPEGSNLRLTFTSNKDLGKVTLVRLTDTDDVSPPQPLKIHPDDPRTFAYQVSNLRDDLRLRLTLDDTDGVSSPRPYALTLGVVPDQAPTVNAGLVGIGSAITPLARLPIQGAIHDDYGVAESWFEIELGETEERRFPLELDDPQQLDAVLDLQPLRDQGFTLTEGQRIVLSVQATDRCTLDGQPNVAHGDRYELEIVSPNRLLARLEARELGHRRRLEQIISELEETRDSLARVQVTTSDIRDGAEPEDKLPEDAPERVAAELPADSEANSQQQARRQAALRQLRVERARQHSERSAQEVIGVAAAFEDIRAELINNRVDSQDRQQRLLEDISQPLNEIGEQEYPLLTGQLIQLEDSLKDPEQASQTLEVALGQTDEILTHLRSVLDKMLDLESYNELVDLLRTLIDEQNDLIEGTRKRQQQQTLELLE